MMPVQFRIDLFSEIRGLLGSFEPVVLPGVVQELTGLSRAQGNEGAAARFGLTLAEQCMLEGGNSTSLPVDDQVIAWARENHGTVVTNDRRVRDALLAEGLGVISMRKQKKLEIVRR
jgi:hypothetical protein